MHAVQKLLLEADNHVTLGRHICSRFFGCGTVDREHIFELTNTCSEKCGLNICFILIYIWRDSDAWSNTALENGTMDQTTISKGFKRCRVSFRKGLSLSATSRASLTAELEILKAPVWQPTETNMGRIYSQKIFIYSPKLIWFHLLIDSVR